MKFYSKYNTIVLIILIIFLFIIIYSNFIRENMDTYKMKNLLINTGSGMGRFYEMDTDGNFSEKEFGLSVFMSGPTVSTNTTSPIVITTAPPQITTIPIITTTPPQVTTLPIITTTPPTQFFNPNLVTVYTGKGQTGLYAQLGVGNYTSKDLLSNGITDKSIQSVHVPSGKILVLFEDDNYEGNSLYVTNDVNSFNTSVNSFSSLKIR